MAEELTLEQLKAMGFDAPEDGASSEALTPEQLAGMGFDAPAPAPQSRKTGPLRALGSSLLQGYFKGGSDEAVGGLTRLRVAPGNGAAWRGADGDVRQLRSAGDVYRAGRDTEREVLRGAAEEYPKSSFVANMAGDLASDATLRALGVPGVGSTAYNVATGALSGFLGSDAELSEDQATPENLASAGGSAALGAGLGYVVPKIGERLTPVAMRALRQFLQNRAVSQGGKALLSGADSLSSRGALEPSAVLEALRFPPEGGVPAILPGGTATGAFKRLEALAAERGATYASILDDLEQAGVTGPEADSLARELSSVGEDLLTRTGKNKAVPNLYLDEAANVEALARGGPGKQGPMAQALGLTQAEDVKRALQQEARYGRFEDTPLNEAKKDVARRFRQAIEDSVDDATQAAPPASQLRELGESFVPVKQRLGRTIEARDAAERGAARSSQRRGGPNFLAASAMGATNPVDAYAKGAGWSLLSERLPSTLASASYAGSELAALLANREVGNALGRSVARSAAPRLDDYLADYLDPEGQQRAALIQLLRQRKE